MAEQVQVIVRIRPLNEKEKKQSTLPVVSASSTKNEVTVIRGSGARQMRHVFKFDGVFSGQSTQAEVFDRTLRPMIHDVLNGFESTVFAYGQTGTGKTHTMEGDIASEADMGVIPRAARAIFESLADEDKYESYDVKASYLEIYNEELSDLLDGVAQADMGATAKAGALAAAAGAPAKLQIVDGGKGGGVRVMGLSEVSVASKEDVVAVLRAAQEKRRVGETRMNKASSRSHCVCTLTVTSTARADGGAALVRHVGKLHLCDLAGSECAKTAGNSGPGSSVREEATREAERRNINQSLLTLGRVITTLRAAADGDKSAASARIPYRDSKLTRLLQESLGGRCKTCVIATGSPSVLAVDETLSTLTYAQRAHGIQNKPVAQSRMMSVAADKGVGALAKDGDGAGADGGSHQDWHEMECRLQYLKAEAEEAQAALARKHAQLEEDGLATQCGGAHLA